jgi:hypothetical protein
LRCVAGDEVPAQAPNHGDACHAMPGEPAPARVAAQSEQADQLEEAMGCCWHEAEVALAMVWDPVGRGRLAMEEV